MFDASVYTLNQRLIQLANLNRKIPFGARLTYAMALVNSHKIGQRRERFTKSVAYSA